jgi:heat shock protein HslJ/uncharacterized lipoprotein NlpE involved in copper resistance
MRVVLLFAAVTLSACARLPATEAPAAANAAPVASGSAAASVLNLPSTFEGVLPCADCAGIRHHLDLWPDGVFHLRREWLGTGGVALDLGRWLEAPQGGAIVLEGSNPEPIRFAVTGPNALRLLDRQGRPIESSLPYSLEGLGALEPATLSRPLHGLFTYLADAPGLQECYTGRFYPVAMTGDYLALERAYLGVEKPAPGAPVMAYLDGEIGPQPAMEGDALVPTVSVQRFIGLFPQQSCERARSEARLSNTYWKIVSIGDDPLPPVEGGREPHLLLRSGRPEFAATAGCNRLGGTYEISGKELVLQPGPMTRMACPPPLDALEGRLAAALDAVRSWRVQAQVLELFDAAGDRAVLLEAVYLP